MIISHTHTQVNNYPPLTHTLLLHILSSYSKYIILIKCAKNIKKTPQKGETTEQIGMISQCRRSNFLKEKPETVDISTISGLSFGSTSHFVTSLKLHRNSCPFSDFTVKSNLRFMELNCVLYNGKPQTCSACFL